MKRHLYLIMLLCSCSATTTIPTQPDVVTTKKVIMNPSFYNIAVESEKETGDDMIVFSPEGKPLVEVRESFYKRLTLEGTGMLRDGRLLNFHSKKDGNIRFQFVPYPIGARNARIYAFKSVAVDPKFIPLGARLFIPKTKGIKLPDGTIHDGFWRADDVGSAIKGNRLDLFTGEYKWKILEEQGVIHGKDLEVEILNN